MSNYQGVFPKIYTVAGYWVIMLGRRKIKKKIYINCLESIIKLLSACVQQCLPMRLFSFLPFDSLPSEIHSSVKRDEGRKEICASLKSIIASY